MPLEQNQPLWQRQNQPQNQILQRQNQQPIGNPRSMQSQPIQSRFQQNAGRSDVLSANENQYQQQMRQSPYQQSNQNGIFNQRDGQQHSFWQRGQAPQPVDGQQSTVNKNDSQPRAEEKGFLERLKERFEQKEQGSALRPVDGERNPSAWEQQSTQEKMQDRMNRLQERAQQQMNKGGDKSLSDNYGQSKDGYNSQIRRGNQPGNAQPNGSQPANAQNKNGLQPSGSQARSKANDLSQADESNPILHKGKDGDAKGKDGKDGKDNTSCKSPSSCAGL